MADLSTETAQPPRQALAALFLLTLATLVLEIASTRMFSVIMAYHFAVLSISMAMLGLAGGAVFVYTRWEELAERGVIATARDACTVFAIAVFVSVVRLLWFPLQPDNTWLGFTTLVLVMVPLALPYLAAGTATAMLLAAYPGRIGILYAVDLAGAALGCAAVVLVLPILGGGGTLVLSGLLGACAAAVFARASERPAARWLSPYPWMIAAGSCLLLAPFTRLLEPRYIKGVAEPSPDRIAWTSYSRVAFTGELERPLPFGWGYSATVPRPASPSRYRLIRIDGMAESPILKFTGRKDDFAPLWWDVSSFPYLLRTGGRALIIGSGGGRDILAAQLSGAWTVDAVEINEAIVEGMTGPFADYSGNVYGRQGVRVRVLDGRSALERAHRRSYDLIQMSAVDTWAAGVSGAFALMENGLYTVESFRAALRALSPSGLMSVSRFNYRGDEFGETVRTVALAIEALETGGFARPGEAHRHVLLLQSTTAPAYSLSTLLVSPTPIRPEEVGAAVRLARERAFPVIWPPGEASAGHPAARLLATSSREARRSFFDTYPIDVRPTFDDRPYFFHQTRLSKALRTATSATGGAELRLVPVATVLRLGLLLLVATLALVLVPLLRQRGVRLVRPPGSALLYFAAIGIGFMLFEIPLVQQLTLGLGHPVYALAVVLFGLLLGTGVGSLFAGRVPERRRRAVHFAAGVAAAGLGIALAELGVPFSHLLFRFSLPERVASAAAAVLACGLILGTLLPFGVRSLVASGRGSTVAWCWAANGAASVLASVAALLLGTEAGMRVTFIVAGSCYLVALGAAFWPRPSLARQP